MRIPEAVGAALQIGADAKLWQYASLDKNLDRFVPFLFTIHGLIEQASCALPLHLSQPSLLVTLVPWVIARAILCLCGTNHHFISSGSERQHCIAFDP